MRALINGNCAQCEDANEWVDFFTGSEPLNISYFELVNPFVVPVGSVGGAYGGNGSGDNLNVNWVPGNSYSAYQIDYINNLNLFSGCNVFLPVPVNNIIPAGSRVIAFTGAAPDASYNLSDMCGLGNVYVLFANRNICPTSSGKYANAGCSTNCSRFLSIFNHQTGCCNVRPYIASPVATATGSLYVFEGPLVGYVGNISCLALTLPSTFLSLTGFSVDGKNQLLWTVNQESNVLSYEIQRSADNVNFETCGHVMSNVTQGVNDYQFIDHVSSNVSLNYYRVAMIENDGFRQFSDVVAIEKTDDWEIALNDISGLMVRANVSCVVDLYLFDLSGKMVSSLVLNLQEGWNFVGEVNIPSGMHCCVIRQNDLVVCVRRLAR